VRLHDLADDAAGHPDPRNDLRTVKTEIIAGIDNDPAERRISTAAVGRCREKGAGKFPSERQNPGGRGAMKGHWTKVSAIVCAAAALGTAMLCAAVSTPKEEPGAKIEGPLQVTLSQGRDNRLVLHFKNVSSSNVSFVDVPEGSGFCDWVYQVTAKDAEGKTTGGGCVYAPGIEPLMITLLPAGVYDREIQPGAYARRPNSASCEITVTYRIQDQKKQLLLKQFNGLPDVNITFTTLPIQVKTGVLFGQ